MGARRPPGARLNSRSTFEREAKARQRIIEVSLSPNQRYTRMDMDYQGRVLWVARHIDNQHYYMEVSHDSWGINAIAPISGQLSFQYYNHRGDQLAVYQPASNTVIENPGFDPYGESAANANANMYVGYGNPFTWGGRDQTIYSFSNLSGLWHTITMGHREYSPALHGFLQADPEPSRDGSTDTPYSYVGYDPVNHIDPDGRRTVGAAIKGACAKLVIATTDKKACDKVWTLGQAAEGATINVWNEHVDGGPSNAFRHAHWMGLITLTFQPPLGSTNSMNSAIRIGDAYEKDNMKDCINRNKDEDHYGDEATAKSYCRANAKMDKANNRVGASMVGMNYFGCTDHSGSNWLPKCILRNMEKGQVLTVLKRRSTKKGPRFSTRITPPVTAPTCTSNQNPWCP